METYAKDAAADAGKLAWMLKLSSRERKSYKEFLKRFAVVREEVSVDMDSFDYGFYMYGLQHYGNMPLIEENEFREAKKIEELVIAIDTSASCKEKLVQQFLNETGAILKHQESFSIKCISASSNVITRFKRYSNHKSGRNRGIYRAVFRFRRVWNGFSAGIFLCREIKKQRGTQKLKRTDVFYGRVWRISEKPTDYQTVFVFTGMTHRRKFFGRADKSAGLGSEIIFVRGYKRIDKGEIL